MSSLRFPSGERYDLATLPRQSSGRTTLADGSEGAQLHPELACVPAPSFVRVPTNRLATLAADLGALLDAERNTASDEPWFSWAATVERQALGELARRAI